MKSVNIKNHLSKVECVKSEICKIYEGGDVSAIGNDFGYGIYQFMMLLEGKKDFEVKDVIDLIFQSQRKFFKIGTTLDEMNMMDAEYKAKLKNKIKKGY